jgi:hypothetical protein
MWYDGYMTTNRGIRIVACLMALVGLFTLTGCPVESPTPKRTHRVQPAPNPDPARPQPGRSFPGNVSITFWLEQDAHRTVTSFNVGGGPQTHYCNDSCHWSATAKPTQVVTSTTDYYAVGQKGWLHMQVVQNNNGRILCDDDNSDTGRSGGVTCTGTVTI